jgi:iron complex transport system ATP-binding protein
VNLFTHSSLPLIEYRHVSVIRSGQIVLNDVSISIRLGEHVAILGPNGSGKSSLVKTITRELYPQIETQGSYLRIMGKDSWNVFELRSLLGVVSDELLEGRARNFSGEEVILSGFFSSSRIWPHQLVTSLMKQKVAEVLELLEITHLSDRRIGEMSTGEARRFLIGRALVHEPKALVLDEPTSSLDLRATVELHAILRKIANDGTSIIMITHQLPDIIHEIKRVILIKKGRIVEDGMKEKVLTSALLSQLFEIPVAVVKHNGYYQLL